MSWSALSREKLASSISVFLCTVLVFGFGFTSIFVFVFSFVFLGEGCGGQHSAEKNWPARYLSENVF